MKKVVFLFLATSMVLFSCNKETEKNDNNDPIPFEIEGVWEITKIEECDVITNPDPGEEDLCETSTNAGTLTLNEDGTGGFSISASVANYFPESFTYTYNNKMLEIVEENSAYNYTTEYTVTEKGNRMTLVNIEVVNQNMSWKTTIDCTKGE